MSSFGILLLCIQVCLIQITFSQCTGTGLMGNGLGLGYGLTRPALGGLGCGETLAPGFGGYGWGPGIAGYGMGGIARMDAYGGAGVGDVAVAGELPVGGATAVAGQVPIIGAVQFGGAVPAAGAVSITGSCGGCGCNDGYFY